ncbi:MAG: phosphotransferase [Nocardioides sp.]
MTRSAFSMTAEELAGIFDQIPALSGRPRELRELSGGLTNRNFHVIAPGGEFVARCSDLSGNALGIDRDAEHFNTAAAAAAGVGAEAVAYRPDLGVLVVRFLQGRTLSRASFAEPGVIGRVATACRALHAGPRFQGEFDMFERQRGYLATVQAGGFTVPDGYHDHDATIAEIRRALAVRDEGTVPCNNDLLAENFIDDGAKVWLIDYEYAGNNDACFELGNIWCECHLSLAQLEELVTAYYGRPRPSRLARARLLGVVGAWGWTLWGAIQHATSPLDFDFWAWTMERYEIAVRELTGPDLPALLHDVQQED